jgi:hypothetical protein
VSSYSMGKHMGWLRLKEFREEPLGGRSSPQRGFGGNGGSKSGVESGSPMAGVDTRSPGWGGAAVCGVGVEGTTEGKLTRDGGENFGAVAPATIWPLPVSFGATGWTNGGGGVRGCRSEALPDKQRGEKRERAGANLGTWERRRRGGLGEQHVGLKVYCSVR